MSTLTRNEMAQMISRRAVFRASAAFACALALPSPVLAQQSMPGKGTVLFATLQSRLATLTEKATYSGASQLPVFERAEAALLELERNLNLSQQQVPPEYRAYVQGVEQSLPALSEVAAGLSPEAAARLEDLTADLRSKSRYFQAGVGIAPFFKNLLITVEVRTYAKGKPIDGYEVACNPASFPVDSAPRYTFASTTNNSRRQLPPGIYNMTLSRAGVTVRKRIEIGEDGRPQQVIHQEMNP